MRYASSAILILVTIILVLILSVLLYRPKEMKKPRQAHPSPRTVRDTEGLLLNGDLDFTEKMIRLRWPYSTWMMEFIHLKESMILHWQGLVRDPGRSVLLYAGSERTLQMIMEAVSRFNSDHDQPACDLWIALPSMYEDQYYSSAEVRRYFLTHEIPLECVYCDGRGMEALFSQEADTALIAFGTKAMAEFKIEGDEANVQAYRDAIKDAAAADPAFTDVSRTAVSGLYSRMPWRMRMYLRLPVSDADKISRLTALFPFTKEWFSAELSFYKDTFVLQAVSEEQKEEAIGQLEKMAEKYSVSLKLKAERNTASMPDSTSEEYRKLVRMIQESMEPEYILPFLSNDIYTPYFRGLPAVFFSPMRSLVTDSAEKAIRYYYEIIMNS